MKKILIFGITEMAEMVHYYFSRIHFCIDAFVVDGQYLTQNTFCKLPVIPTEEAIQKLLPEDYAIFIAIGYTNRNEIKKLKYQYFADQGYHFPTYIDKSAVTEDALIGENCLILENVTVQPFVKVGNNVTIWSGSQICHHTTIDAHCYISPNATIAGFSHIKEQCFIGANAVIRDHITVEKKSVVGAGSLIMSDTSEDDIFFGLKSEAVENPAPYHSKILNKK